MGSNKCCGFGYNSWGYFFCEKPTLKTYIYIFNSLFLISSLPICIGLLLLVIYGGGSTITLSGIVGLVLFAVAPIIAIYKVNKNTFLVPKDFTIYWLAIGFVGVFTDILLLVVILLGTLIFKHTTEQLWTFVSIMIAIFVSFQILLYCNLWLMCGWKRKVIVEREAPAVSGNEVVMPFCPSVCWSPPEYQPLITRV